MGRKQAFSGKHADVTDKVLKAFFKIYNTSISSVNIRIIRQIRVL